MDRMRGLGLHWLLSSFQQAKWHQWLKQVRFTEIFPAMAEPHDVSPSRHVATVMVTERTSCLLSCNSASLLSILYKHTLIDQEIRCAVCLCQIKIIKILFNVLSVMSLCPFICVFWWKNNKARTTDREMPKKVTGFCFSIGPQLLHLVFYVFTQVSYKSL